MQRCHGETAPTSEDFFVGVLEEVRKNRDCWTRTGGNRWGSGGMRHKDPLEIVRQCTVAHDGMGIGHILRKGFNFVSGFAGWSLTGACYIYDKET